MKGLFPQPEFSQTGVMMKPLEIDMAAVVSSQIAAVGYHADAQVLAIQFANRGDVPGSVYHYQNVTAEDFAAFRDAESIGKHFYKHIKPFAEKHPYEKIERAPEVVPASAAEAAAVGEASAPA